MDLEQLKQDFIKIGQQDGQTAILVRTIGWAGPHTPTSSWLPAMVLSEAVSPMELAEKVDEVMENEEYFGTCNECSERNPRGWIHDKQLCSSCAERNHGIVY